MITYIYGDIFYSPARVLVNPVNTVGAMNAGLAKDFKRFYPTMYEQYKDLCQRDQFDVGQLLLYRTAHKWVLNFPTKKHWRADSTMDYIEDGLKKFARIYADEGITSISFPQLGTGAGKLAWDDVRPLMLSYLEPLPITVYIHLYSDNMPFASDTRNTRAMRHWLNSQPELLDFEVFWGDLVEVIRAERDFFTLQDHTAFSAVAIEARGRQRASLKISPRRADSIFIPETQLLDLWHYVRRAGYTLPQNLPAGLEAASDFVITLLAKLPYLHPAQMATLNGEPVIGLHYIPPIAHQDPVHLIDLNPRTHNEKGN